MLVTSSVKTVPPNGNSIPWGQNAMDHGIKTVLDNGTPICFQDSERFVESLASTARSRVKRAVELFGCEAARLKVAVRGNEVYVELEPRR